MPQLYIQKNAQPDTWVMSGAPTATTVFLSLDATINYSDGTSDTLPANTLAVLPDTTTVFDRTHDVFVCYTVQTSHVLSVIKESLLPTLTSAYAPLCRIELHSIKPYQPEPYLAAGGLGGPPVTTTPAISDTTNRVKALWNGSSNDAPPASWYQAAYDDSAWASAVAAGGHVGYAPPAGATWIWNVASPPAQTDALLVRKGFTLPAGAIGSATLSVVVDDKLLAVYVNGTAVSGLGIPWDNTGGSATRTADVTALLLPGAANCIAIEAQNNSPAPSPNTAGAAYALTVTSTGVGAASDPTTSEGDLIYRHSGALARLPIGPSGDVLTSDGADPAWAPPVAGGVTSVGLSMPAEWSVSGSPVTGASTLTVSKVAQSAATVYAAPASGSAAAPTFRTLQASDLPAAAAAGGHRYAHGHFT